MLQKKKGTRGKIGEEPAEGAAQGATTADAEGQEPEVQKDENGHASESNDSEADKQLKQT